MSQPLWTLGEIATVTGAELVGGDPNTAVTGVSIDTRTIATGDLFVALKDVRDGHDFVTLALEKRASAALIRRDYQAKQRDAPLLRVDDPLRALVALGEFARKRLSDEARVIAVTGSVGKTTTKEMLRACLEAVAPGRVHASEKSYNNHWGVPLTLARMPKDTQYGVFEIGMNHAGEIAVLSPMVRPHVAIITTVAAVHLEHFPGGVADIARAKAEIFDGLEPGGVAILPRDNEHYGLLKKAASARDVLIKSFGANGDLDSVYDESSFENAFDQQFVTLVDREGYEIDLRLGLRGSHMAENALAVALALQAINVDVTAALPALEELNAGAGRGKRTYLAIPTGELLLIDESYNANSASILAALATARDAVSDSYPRFIAVLGDMLELGPTGPELHRGLTSAIEANNVDLVFAVGPLMGELCAELRDRHLWLPLELPPSPSPARHREAMLRIDRASSTVSGEGRDTTSETPAFTSPGTGEGGAERRMRDLGDTKLKPNRRYFWAPTARELEPHLLAAVQGGDVVMIKGSNGMRMSTLVEALIARHNAAHTTQ